MRETRENQIPSTPPELSHSSHMPHASQPPKVFSPPHSQEQEQPQVQEQWQEQWQQQKQLQGQGLEKSTRESIHISRVMGKMVDFMEQRQHQIAREMETLDSEVRKEEMECCAMGFKIIKAKSDLAKMEADYAKATENLEEMKKKRRRRQYHLWELSGKRMRLQVGAEREGEAWASTGVAVHGVTGDTSVLAIRACQSWLGPEGLEWTTNTI